MRQNIKSSDLSKQFTLSKMWRFLKDVEFRVIRFNPNKMLNGSDRSENNISLASHGNNDAWAKGKKKPL